MNKKLVIAMTTGGVLFIGAPAMANIASQQYVDRITTERIVPLEAEVAQHELDIVRIDAAIENMPTDTRVGTIETTVTGHGTAIQGINTALEGKADLAGPGVAGAIATVDAEGQFIRAIGPGGVPMTVEGLRDHVQAQVAAGIDTTVGTAVSGAIGAVEGRVTTAEGNITTLEARTVDIQTGNVALGTRLTTVEGMVTGHEDDVVRIDGNVADLDGRVITVEGRTTHAQTGNVALGTRLTTVEGALETLGDLEAIAELDGRVISVEGTAAALVVNDTIAKANSAVQFDELGLLATAPLECANPTNSCVLTTNGTTVAWEVIAR